MILSSVRDTMILWIVNGKWMDYNLFYGYWKPLQPNATETELFDVWASVRGNMLHFPTGWYEDWNDCPICNADPHDCDCDRAMVKRIRNRCTAMRRMLQHMDDLHRERWRGNGCPEFTPSPLLYRTACRLFDRMQKFIEDSK